MSKEHFDHFLLGQHFPHRCFWGSSNLWHRKSPIISLKCSCKNDDYECCISIWLFDRLYNLSNNQLIRLKCNNNHYFWFFFYMGVQNYCTAWSSFRDWSEPRFLGNSFHDRCEKVVLLDALCSEFQTLQNGIKKADDTMICSAENNSTVLVIKTNHDECVAVFSTGDYCVFLILVSFWRAWNSAHNASNRMTFSCHSWKLLPKTLCSF